MSLLDTKIDNKLLKQLETQRANLLEQIKVMKFQERDEIEKILKKCISEFVGISWYDNSPDYFCLLIGSINISEILELNKYLINWNIDFDSYSSTLIKLRFNRIEK